MLTLALVMTAQLSAPALGQMVIYEANIRALAPKVSLTELASRLERIRDCGANTLWLMPIYPVGQKNAVGTKGSPYAVRDYTAVNPEFGTPASMHVLVERAHSLGMRVILDWVANHTAWDNRWIKDHPSWYLHDSTGAITFPPGTNWKDVAALDYKNPEMQRQMIASMRFWIDQFGVDGFRCDAADYVPLPFWKSAISSLRARSKKPLFFLGEGGNTGLYAAGFDVPYGWNFFSTLRETYGGAPAHGLGSSSSRELAGLTLSQSRLRFTTNHDESAFHDAPSETFHTPAGVQGATVLASLSGGVPMIYTGQEVGWNQPIGIFDWTQIEWKPRLEWMKQLFAARKAHLALQHPPVGDLSTADVVIWRYRSASDEALVVVNVRGTAQPVTLPSLSGSWKDVWTQASGPLAGQVSLAPYESRVYMRGE